MIKIDKNIPMPRGNGGKALWEDYPFAKMKVGDSFYVENMKGSRFSPIIQGYINSIWKDIRPEVKFSCRSDVKGGVRVWRVR